MKTNNMSNVAHLRVCAFGMGIGVAKALFLMLIAWIAGLYGYHGTVIHNLMDLIPGYEPNFLGGLIGGAWGFISGFIFGAIAGLVYNCCIHCSCRCCCNCPDCTCKNCCNTSKK